jgi:histone-lysine N-methyltransferase SETMAR
MKLGYLVTHPRISDNQCNGATRSPTAKIFKTSPSNRKIMATIFWDRKGPLLVNFLVRGDTINAAAYCEMLEKLRWDIRNKRRGMLMRGVCLLHDNACPHTARVMQELLQSFKWEVLAHPPHSPDLTLSDYHFISKLKESLAGKSFSGDDKVQAVVMTWLREQAGDFYDAGIKKLVPGLTKCITIHGDYAEK